MRRYPRDTMLECPLTTGAGLASELLRRIERNGYQRKGRPQGQSHGWKLLNYLRIRYNIPRAVVEDIVNGCLRTR